MFYWSWTDASVFGSQVFGQTLMDSCEITWLLFFFFNFWKREIMSHLKCVTKHKLKLQPHLALKQDVFCWKVNFVTKIALPIVFFLNGTLGTFVVPIEADLQQLPWRVISGNPAYGRNWLSQHVLKVAPPFRHFFALICTY